MFDFFEKHKEENPGILWFVVILIVLFIMWILTGGPERSKDERNNQFLRPLEPLGSGETYHRDIWQEIKNSFRAQ